LVTMLVPENKNIPCEFTECKKGFHIVPYKKKHRFHSFLNIDFMRTLHKEIQKHETSVLVEYPYQGLMVHVLSKLFSYPYVLDCHDIETTRLKGLDKKLFAMLLDLPEKFLIKKADSVLVTTHNDALLMQSRKLRTPTLIPNGVDIEQFKPIEKDRSVLEHLGIKNETVCMFYGNFNDPHNARAASLISTHIAPKVYEKDNSVRFLLVGDNPPPLNYHPSIITTGYVDNIETYISVSDLIILPLNSSGGTRLKILEAMSCGKPVIATYLGIKGLPIDEGHNILLAVDTEFHRKIAACLSGTYNLSDISIQARKKALEFDWELILSPLKDILYTSSDNSAYHKKSK